MVLTAYYVLTPERLGLIVSVTCETSGVSGRKGRHRQSASSAPATRAPGRHALAVRQRAARQANAFASIASRLACRDDRDAPLSSKQDARTMPVIWGRSQG